MVYLLHGWGMHSRLWGRLPERLNADGCRARLIDLPGHGGTPSLPQMNLPILVNTLADQVTEPGYLIGWSLGGLAALAIADTYPERVLGLTLTGTSPCFVQRPDWPYGMDTNTFNDFVTRTRSDPAGVLSGFLGLQAQGSTDARRTLREMRARLAEAPVADRAALLDGLEILEDGDLRTRLGRIGHSTVIIHGDRDGLVPLLAAEQLAAALPSACLTPIEGAGHAPFLSHPSKFYRALREDADD